MNILTAELSTVRLSEKFTDLFLEDSSKFKIAVRDIFKAKLSGLVVSSQVTLFNTKSKCYSRISEHRRRILHIELKIDLTFDSFLREKQLIHC